MVTRTKIEKAITDVITILQDANMGNDTWIDLDVRKSQKIFTCHRLLMTVRIENLRESLFGRLRDFRESANHLTMSKAINWADGLGEIDGGCVTVAALMTVGLIIPLLFILYLVVLLVKGLTYLAAPLFVVAYKIILTLLWPFYGGILALYGGILVLYEKILTSHKLSYYPRQVCMYFGISRPKRNDIIERFKQLQRDFNCRIRWSTAYGLGKIDRDTVVELLRQAHHSFSHGGKHIPHSTVLC